MRFLSQVSPQELLHKRILLRADFNVPITEGNVGDDTRIRQTIPTILEILKAGASVAICSHLGRPAGKPSKKYSLRPVAEHLEKLLGHSVRFLPNPLEDKFMDDGEVLLLENTRFFEEEEKNNIFFAASLARGCDFFVNDAFGTAHRAHASNAGIASVLPGMAGLLLEKEVSLLGEILKNPSRPLAFLVGGAKMKDKIGVLNHFAETANVILLGGGIANTFLAAAGKNVGDSLFEPSEIKTAQEILAKATENGCEIVLPSDAVVANEVSPTAPSQIKSVDAIVGSDKILDLGPASIKEYSARIASAQMLVWNGPVGLFEFPPFSEGTRALAEAAQKCPGKTIIGGGDTLDALARFGFPETDFDHLSTGGGAMLEFLEGKILPGIEILESSPSL